MGRRILVVDDDDDVLEIFQLLLKRKYSVTTLSEAEGLLNGPVTEPFDLAIFDHRMRTVTSNDLIPLLKQKPEWQDTHFVIHSGIANLASVAAISCADGYLPKPSSIEQILAYIAGVFDKKS